MRPVRPTSTRNSEPLAGKNHFRKLINRGNVPSWPVGVIIGGVFSTANDIILPEEKLLTEIQD